MGGYDNSPILMIPPIDNACVNEPFYHNPGAYDPDGDSLSYKLVPCRGDQGLVIPGYTLPPATHSITLNPLPVIFYGTARRNRENTTLPSSSKNGGTG